MLILSRLNSFFDLCLPRWGSIPHLFGKPANTMDAKRRRYFHLENADGKRLAYGILYDEGNVQILWRDDCGHTAEQYASINLVLDLVPGISVLRLEGGAGKDTGD